MARPRRAGCLLLATSILVATPAVAAGRPLAPDQYCAPVASHSGYTGTTFSQSFHPRAATIAAVDVLLASVRTQRILPRLRLVGQHSLPDGLAMQTVVLGQQQQFVSLPAYRPTWVRLRLPAPLTVSSAGPAVDQLAVQVVLPPNDDSVVWLVCDGYLRGNGQQDSDPGATASRDTGTALAVSLPRGLAFREYAR